MSLNIGDGAPTCQGPLTSVSDHVGLRVLSTLVPTSPWSPLCLSLTFQQGLQDGHVHVVLAILALPEDGQQLPPPDNVLDLQQAFPSEVRSDKPPTSSKDTQRIGAPDTELEPWA